MHAQTTNVNIERLVYGVFRGVESNRGAARVGEPSIDLCGAGFTTIRSMRREHKQLPGGPDVHLAVDDCRHRKVVTRP